MRLAVLTVSPKTSYVNECDPMTPATTLPAAMPIFQCRSHFLFSLNFLTISTNASAKSARALGACDVALLAITKMLDIVGVSCNYFVRAGVFTCECLERLCHVASNLN